MDKLVEVLKIWWDKVLLAVVVILFLVIVLPAFVNAKESGMQLGNSAGKAAGYAAGLLEADRKTAEENGKKEALTNPETDVKIIGPKKLQETGKLDVLVAGVSLSNFHGVGNKYAALYLMKADAVFSVNLGAATVKYVEDELWVRVIAPQPEVEVFFDETETQKIAEWQKTHFSGSADDGFQAYLSTMQEIEETASQDLLKNETMMKSAREAAEQQIKLLVTSIYGMDVSVTVEFQ